MQTSLSQVRIVDAAFIWTEPHSKRVRVQLTIQKEVCVCFFFFFESAVLWNFFSFFVDHGRSSAATAACCRVPRL